MKYLILSDVHGNRFGLDAVLADANGVYAKVLCLGDVVGYGAHPNQCCELLRQHGAVCLLGNHDAAALGMLGTRWFNDAARFAVEWTARELDAENREWLGGLKPAAHFDADGFLAVHGSLRQPLEEYILNPGIAAETFKLMGEPLCFYGHTHVAYCYGLAPEAGRKHEVAERDFLQGGSLFPEPDWKYLVNPGSCGQPRDGNPNARYALFDSESREIDVCQVEYDTIAARQAILDAGLPRGLGDRLLYGR